MNTSKSDRATANIQSQRWDLGFLVTNLGGFCCRSDRLDLSMGLSILLIFFFSPRFLKAWGGIQNLQQSFNLDGAG
ncbi:hypothetical protein N0Y54_30930 [Nostoc punctiforme UO1]|uniref:hypothetical protein n=1 Tax=Nostoc punctiforme TaxID=272131 RepID=UPI00309BB5B5